jgi:hypothetical protein
MMRNSSVNSSLRKATSFAQVHDFCWLCYKKVNVVFEESAAAITGVASLQGRFQS